MPGIHACHQTMGSTGHNSNLDLHLETNARVRLSDSSMPTHLILLIDHGHIVKSLLLSTPPLPTPNQSGTPTAGPS